MPLTVAAFVDGGSTNTLKFAAGATVFINPGTLTVNSKTPIVTWEEKPANIGTVNFKWSDPAFKRVFVRRNDGLYSISGFVIFVK